MEKEPKRDEKEELGLPIKMEEEEFIKKLFENKEHNGSGDKVEGAHEVGVIAKLFGVQLMILSYDYLNMI